MGRAGLLIILHYSSTFSPSFPSSEHLSASSLWEANATDAHVPLDPRFASNHRQTSNHAAAVHRPPGAGGGRKRVRRSTRTAAAANSDAWTMWRRDPRREAAKHTVVAGKPVAGAGFPHAYKEAASAPNGPSIESPLHSHNPTHPTAAGPNDDDDERPPRPLPAAPSQRHHDHHDERAADCGCGWGAPPRPHNWRRYGRRGGGSAAAGRGRYRRLHRGARGDALLPGNL